MRRKRLNVFVSSEMFSFPHFQGNALAGAVPAEAGQLVALEEMNLSANQVLQGRT
jgi:hypothetical protein